MGFLSEFEDDVFISYAWLDNEPVTEGQKGWVTHFHRDLEKRVEKLLGAEVRIWRDDRELLGHEQFAQKIYSRFPKTGILVSVVSPRYVQSEWCLAELNEFCAKAEETGGLYVQEKSRVFPVVKTPIDRDAAPPQMQQIWDYKFFELDDKGRPFEYDRELGEEAKFKYARKLNDVAYDIANFLRLLSGQLRSVAPRATVYLAETTTDLRESREEVRRDLVRRGFAVLPGRALSPDGGDLRTQVRQLLARCTLSVHLIGGRYGSIPEGETESCEAIEAALAAERCSSPGFLRVLWMPPRLAAHEARQQALIDYLRTDAAAQRGTELLETGIEDLKTFLEDAHATKPQPAAQPRRHGPLRIYVVTDPEDAASSAVAALAEHLFAQGYEVMLSVAGDDETRIREDHLEHLRLCDACLIYCGSSGELWLRAKLNDLRKVLDARPEPVRARAVYLAAPEAEYKRRFQTREALVLRSTDAFSVGALAPFLEQLRSTAG